MGAGGSAEPSLQTHNENGGKPLTHTELKGRKEPHACSPTHSVAETLLTKDGLIQSWELGGTKPPAVGRVVKNKGELPPDRQTEHVICIQGFGDGNFLCIWEAVRENTHTGKAWICCQLIALRRLYCDSDFPFWKCWFPGSKHTHQHQQHLNICTESGFYESGVGRDSWPPTVLLNIHLPSDTQPPPIEWVQKLIFCPRIDLPWRKAKERIGSWSLELHWNRVPCAFS